MERTLIIIKPDAMERGLLGDILSRFERRGLKTVALKMMRIDEALAKRHYGEHEGKPFFPGLIAYITSAPVVVAVLEGPRAIQVARQTMGATDPAKAAPGTIRADLGLKMERNLVHGSDGPETAEREIALFFGEDELIEWQRSVDRWIIE